MRHSAHVALLSAASALISGSAFAQGVDEFGAFGGLEDRANQESKQSVAVEFRFGRYVPRVDSEFDNATPFEDSFGDSSRYMLGVEVDWQALRIPFFGSIGPGFGWGLTKASGQALFDDDSGERSLQETTLTVMPVYAVGVVRVDVLAKETFIPVVPYGKLGLGGALWWVGDGGQTAQTDDGDRGEGISYGYQFALGGMLLLDFFDPVAARAADNSIGVNNSYLFGEWYYSDLSGFGGEKRMNVGANTWFVGLALEI